MIASYREAFSNPYVAAGRRLVDDMIEPADTRRHLCAGARVPADEARAAAAEEARADAALRTGDGRGSEGRQSIEAERTRCRIGDELTNSSANEMGRMRSRSLTALEELRGVVDELPHASVHSRAASGAGGAAAQACRGGASGPLRRGDQR